MSQGITNVPEIKNEGLPKYLTKGWGENRWRRIARFRLGNKGKESV